MNIAEQMKDVLKEEIKAAVLKAPGGRKPDSKRTVRNAERKNTR